MANPLGPPPDAPDPELVVVVVVVELELAVCSYVNRNDPSALEFATTPRRAPRVVVAPLAASSSPSLPIDPRAPTTRARTPREPQSPFPTRARLSPFPTRDPRAIRDRAPMTLAVPIGAIFPIGAIADVTVAVVIARRSNTSDDRANTRVPRRLVRPRRPARRRRLTMGARIIDGSMDRRARMFVPVATARHRSIDSTSIESIDRSDGCRFVSIGSNRSIDRSDGCRIDRSISRSHEQSSRGTSRTIAVEGERDTRSSRDRSMRPDARGAIARHGTGLDDRDRSRPIETDRSIDRTHARNDATDTIDRSIHRSIDRDRPRGRSPVAWRVARVRTNPRVRSRAGAGRGR